MTQKGLHAWTLLYDGECSFCAVCVAVILVKDRRRVVRPLPLRDESAVALTPGLDEGARMASWHLVAPDGTFRSGGAAVGPLLRLLPLGSPAAAAAERFPGAVDRAYRWTVRHRGRLGRWTPSRCKVWARHSIARRVIDQAW